MLKFTDEITALVSQLRSGTVETHRFDPDEDLKIVVLRDDQASQQSQLLELVRRYYLAGFALFHVSEELAGDGALLSLSQLLGLSAPYVPGHYRGQMGLYEASGLNVIRTADTGGSTAHRAFRTPNEQALHVDGTLQPIGFVKTSKLLCVFQGKSGGESLIFNSVGAFVSFAQNDPDAAAALCNPQSLIRRNLINMGEHQEGPAFSIAGGEIISRYSVDNTSDWEPGLEKVPNLRRAYEYLNSLACDGSPFFLRLTLHEGQGIMIANDKIAHGRTAYTDWPNMPRKMIRGLFLNRPTVRPHCPSA